MQPPTAGVGGAAAGAGGGVGAVALPPGIIFSPWQGDIDLNTKQGKALWDEGITPMESKFTGQGKDLVRFIALVTNQVAKCYWHSIVTVNNKSLLTHYGEISKAEVVADRTARRTAPIATLADARPRINALMLFHFLYNSLGPLPQKKLNTRLAEIDQDGPLLLKMILDDTFIATNASTYTIKEQFYDLHLKQYKWNVQALNLDVREKCADLKAAGNASDETDLMISLFRAYNTSTNDEFKNSVLFWKNEWNANTFTTAEELMTRADAKYVELRSMGTWGKQSNKDQQIVALTMQLEELLKNKQPSSASSVATTTTTSTKTSDSKKNQVPKWKYDKSLSAAGTLERNGKTYHWCTGPGHQGKAMWTIHKPGTCGKDSSHSSKSSGKGSGTTNNKTSTFDLKAVAAGLLSQGMSEDEVTSKMEAIMAVINS